MKHILNPRLKVVLSMAIFGTIGLFVRNISVSSGELALYRAVMAVIVLSGVFLITGQKIPFREIQKELPLLLISGVAMGFNWILLFQAYKYTTVSVATLSYYFAPVIVTLACPILFKEKMGAKQWICFGMPQSALSDLPPYQSASLRCSSRWRRTYGKREKRKWETARYPAPPGFSRRECCRRRGSPAG